MFKFMLSFIIGLLTFCGRNVVNALEDVSGSFFYIRYILFIFTYIAGNLMLNSIS